MPHAKVKKLERRNSERLEFRLWAVPGPLGRPTSNTFQARQPTPGRIRKPVMHTNSYLFPNRLTRRDFLQATTAAVAGLALASAASAEDAPVRIGSGSNTYEWDPNWGKLPAGMKYGFGCGII